MRRICLIFMLVLTLAGCKTMADIKPDTIVDIPLRPTAAATEASTETEPEPTETEPPETEPPTEAVTEKSGSNASGGTSSGGKKPGKGDSGSKTPTQVTQPPTDPPTEPPTEAPTEPPSYDPGGYTPGSLDRAVAEAVNAQRQEAGLEPLTFDSRLCAIASVRAWELTMEWSHRRPDGSDGLTVLNQYGYDHSWAAENLYNGAGSGEKIVARWMSAASTADNILSESATVIGVGSYTTAEGLTCVAAIFAG